MTERTTVRLPAELLVGAKLKAAAEGRTLTFLIGDGLWAVVADNSKAVEPRPIVLPVSKRKGG